MAPLWVKIITMLVPTMNQKEVTAEIVRDHDKIEKSTFPRLLEEYRKERKKMQIDPAKTWPKHYAIKTAAKNNWLIFIQKLPSVERFKKAEDAAGFSITYYYSKDGLRVFRYGCSEDNFMEVFNGHLFTRYNERLQLNIPYQLDVIKRFFTNSFSLQHQIKTDRQKRNMVSVCREGLVLGDYMTEEKQYVFKTFISDDLKRNDQRKFEEDLMNTAKVYALLESMTSETEEAYLKAKRKNDTLLQIAGAA